MKIEQDQLIPPVIGFPLGTQNPDGNRDHSTVWFLSKDAHAIKIKASREKIFPFDLEYRAKNSPLIEEYLDQIEKNIDLYVINELTSDMLDEMGFYDPADLQKCFTLGMKREREVIAVEIQRSGVKGEEVFPVLTAKRVTSVFEQESRELLQFLNEIKLPKRDYASFEEEMIELDARLQERVQSRFAW